MIKNLKLNIKNNQLAEVLQKQNKTEESEPKVKKRVAKAPVEAAPVEEEAKPRAQIIRRAKASEETAPGQPVSKDEPPAKAPVEKAAKSSEDLELLSKPIFRDEVAPSKPKLEESPAKETPKVSQEPAKETAPAPAPAAAPVVKLGPKLGAHAPSLSKVNPQVPSDFKKDRPNEAFRIGSEAPRGPRRPYDSSRPEGRSFGSRPDAGRSEGGYPPRAPRAPRPFDPTAPRDFQRPSNGPRDFQRPSNGPRDFQRSPGGSGENARSGYHERAPRSGYNDRGSRPDYQDRGPRPHSDRPAPSGEGSDRPREPRGPSSGDRSGPRPLRIRESFSDRQARSAKEQQERFQQQMGGQTSRPRLGPTGKHFRDLVPPAPPADAPIRHLDQEKASRAASHNAHRKKEDRFETTVTTDSETSRQESSQRTFDRSKPSKAIKKPTERTKIDTTTIEEDGRWRKKRAVKKSTSQVDETIRPSALKVHIPITVKDLAQEMKLKASQLISKLFMQGVAVTLNDALDDETTIQLLGQEFSCDITIDRSEDERLQITSKSIMEEIVESGAHELFKRPPVVAFMGHVDHGKTSLIDTIRQSNRVAGEAGAITQHIGAFSCQTSHGPLTILDTPGHEAFTAMRERGAAVTDVIVLVIAGDEGIKPQTEEAIRHAKAVKATILVAINKCDKPNFNADNVYRQLSEKDLLPEAWGGTIVTVNCSAVTGEGIDQLLEMVALQAEVLELNANPSARARGAVIEAELHKGLGNVATVLVQNGTLRRGDALVFSQSWGRVKTMKDEFGKDIDQAGPSHAARITGLSSLPEAGEDFIVVSSEREAREIAEDRAEKIRQKQVQTRKKVSLEALMQQSQKDKKTLHCILRADVQGSVEALRFELQKIHSDKVEINIINQGIGEISESDVQLAAASGAVIIGFHTRIEAHAEGLIKSMKVKVRQFDVIYHAVDGVKEMMAELLDKIAEEHHRGRIEVKAIFKSSQLGKIAGCQVIEGTVLRSYRVRVIRQSKVIWEGAIASLRRGKDDVREIAKGFECGVLLNGFSDFEPGDILEAFEIVYRAQSL